MTHRNDRTHRLCRLGGGLLALALLGGGCEEPEYEGSDPASFRADGGDDDDDDFGDGGSDDTGGPEDCTENCVKISEADGPNYVTIQLCEFPPKTAVSVEQPPTPGIEIVGTNADGEVELEWLAIGQSGDTIELVFEWWDEDGYEQSTTATWEIP